MRATVVGDTNVLLKWFFEEEPDETAAARELLNLHRGREIQIQVLDLTWYELGNALMYGHAETGSAAAVRIVAEARRICRAVTPATTDFAHAAELAAAHHLSFYDAVYAATARRNGAPLATLDGALLRAGLGLAPTELLEQLTE